MEQARLAELMKTAAVLVHGTLQRRMDCLLAIRDTAETVQQPYAAVIISSDHY